MKPNFFEHIMINSAAVYLFATIIYLLVNAIPSLPVAILLITVLFCLYVFILRKLYKKVSTKRFCKHFIFNLGVAVFSLSGTYIIKFTALKLVFGEYTSLLTAYDIDLFLSNIDFVFIFYFLIIVLLHCSFYEWYFSKKRK